MITAGLAPGCVNFNKNGSFWIIRIQNDSAARGPLGVSGGKVMQWKFIEFIPACVKSVCIFVCFFGLLFPFPFFVKKGKGSVLYSVLFGLVVLLLRHAGNFLFIVGAIVVSGNIETAAVVQSL